MIAIFACQQMCVCSQIVGLWPEHYIEQINNYQKYSITYNSANLIYNIVLLGSTRLSLWRFYRKKSQSLSDQKKNLNSSGIILVLEQTEDLHCGNKIALLTPYLNTTYTDHREYRSDESPASNANLLQFTLHHFILHRSCFTVPPLSDWHAANLIICNMMVTSIGIVKWYSFAMF